MANGPWMSNVLLFFETLNKGLTMTDEVLEIPRPPQALYTKGSINLRGQVLQVIDLWARFIFKTSLKVICKKGNTISLKFP